MAPGLGPPVLGSDPWDTFQCVPDNGLSTGATWAPSLGLSTGAIVVPSLGLDAGACGTPKAEYQTFN